MDDTPIDNPIHAAKQRLAEACMKQGMTPQGAGISAFVNGVVNAALLAAVFEFLVMDEACREVLEPLWLKHLAAKADLFENTARETPRILANRH
jgi:hypothetical protein